MSARRRCILWALLCVLTAISLSAADRPITLVLIPDGLSPEERAPLQAYLSKRMGHQVYLVIPNSYDEVLSGIRDGAYDFANLGAVSYVRAHATLGAVPLVQSASDLNFHTVFITGTNSSIHSLRDLRGRQFAFGDINSASGHVIPYLDLKKAGIKPETDLQIRYTGGHPNTAKLVEAGVVDAGALDQEIFESMLDGGKLDRAKVRVFYTSKPYINYVYVARKGVSEANRGKFSKALLVLKEGKDDKILRILRAKRFVLAHDQEYTSIRQIVKELKLLNVSNPD